MYRQTPLTAPLVDFTDGSILVAADLDTNAKQSIYTQQELDDSLVDGLAGVIPNGDKGDITTSAGGSVWAIDNGAVVEDKIGTGAVVEDKIGTGAVSAAKIASGAVSAAKIASGAFTDSVSSTSTTTIATPNSVKTAYDAALSKARLVLGPSVASTSDPIIDFTSIPSWVKRVTVMLEFVSTNGSSLVQVQLGSGSVQTTGYISVGGLAGASNVALGVNSSTGMVIAGAGAALLRNAHIVITLQSGNVYLSNHYGGLNDPGVATYSIAGGGNVTLGGALDRIRLTTVNGTDTFDAGSVNIIYEG